MTKVNVQVRIPEELMQAVEKMASGSKSEFIRDAIQEKLRRERERQLEGQWVAALKGRSDRAADDADWPAAESWEKR